MNKPDFDYSKLRGRIVEKFGSVSAFSRHLGVLPQQINPKLLGQKGITTKDILEWCEALDIEVSDIGVYFFALKV